jgi:DNA-binding NtrC family response regulator
MTRKVHGRPGDQGTSAEPGLEGEREFAKRSLRLELGLNRILGRSKVVRDLHEKISKISACDVNVLISGESGTGKELAARAIHYLSSRAGRPFVPVNCGAIPESLFENELFGHVRGAFTDARLLQAGLVEEAEGGTLFLDEIGATGPHIQVKLLRLLQDKSYRRLGDSKPRRADIRILAATNMDPRALVEDGKLRRDLFYRLNIVSLYMPPLSKRKSDIPVLVEHFIRKYAREYNRPTTAVSEDAMGVLASHSWPGNIRELENKMQQLIVMSTGPTICAKDIDLPGGPIGARRPVIESFKVAKKKVVDTFERSYLTRLLIECRGDVVAAAARAGKSRTGLWNLLRKHSLSPKEFRPSG